MPVLTVTAAPLGSREAELAALGALCAAVAVPLGLRPADVYAALVTPACAVVGGGTVRAWPVITLHGRLRDPEGMAAALAAVENAAAELWHCPADEVWAQWLPRQ